MQCMEGLKKNSQLEVSFFFIFEVIHCDTYYIPTDFMIKTIME